MSELPKNLFANGASEAAGQAVHPTSAAPAQSATTGAATDGTAPETADAGDAASRPANIILYSDARAKAARETAEAAAKQAATARVRIARRRLKRVAAIAFVAGASGAIAGALAALSLAGANHESAPVLAAADDGAALRAQLAKLETQLATVKVNADHLTRTSAAQFAAIGERFDKVEKTTADAGARIAHLASATPAPSVAAPVTTPAGTAMALPAPRPLPAGAAATLPPLNAASETTASIAAPVRGDVKPKGDLKSDYKAAEAKPPVVEGWVLTSVGRRGSAVVASRSGFYEVYPGDPLPGVGRVEGIRYRDGRWVVLTPKGIIVRR